VSLSANSLGAGGTVSAGAASSLSSNTNVNGLDINMPNVPLEGWAQILPGPGLLAFTAMVVLTMLASAAFDPKLIWERR
jgi:hypothetical protein